MFMAKLDSGCVRWWTPLREVRGFRSLLLGCLRLGTGILGAQMIPEVFKMQKKKQSCYDHNNDWANHLFGRWMWQHFEQAQWVDYQRLLFLPSIKSLIFRYQIWRRKDVEEDETQVITAILNCQSQQNYQCLHLHQEHPRAFKSFN